MTEKRVDVGLDAGGSKTSLLAQYNSSNRVERRGPPANPQRGGLEQSAEVLATLVRDAIQSCRSVAHLSVCAGVAGAGRSDEQDALADHLRRALTEEAASVHVQVVHDAHIALDAAFGTGSGLAVIAGTGSVVFGRARNGTTRRVGGWGYILGDPGSGYALGRAGLQAVAAAFDGGPETTLRARVREQYDLDTRETLIRWVYQEEFSLQNVAPLVIEASAEGDDVASRILSDQVGALVRQVEWLTGQCDHLRTRIALLGGMIQNEHYASALRRALRDRLPAWTVEIVRQPPVVGALRRARRLKGD